MKTDCHWSVMGDIKVMFCLYWECCLESIFEQV